MSDHIEDNCPHCRECPGCEGSCLPEDMANPVLIRLSAAAVGTVCGECMGDGLVCHCACHVGL